MIVIDKSTAVGLVILIPATAFYLFWLLAAASFVRNFDTSDAAFFAIVVSVAMTAPILLGWGWMFGIVAFELAAP